MGMTLEEAIKHCEEVAEKQEITAKSNLIEIDKTKVDGILRIYDADEYESCMKCASDHRQLADWLRELKALLGAEEEIRGMRQVWEEGVGIQKCIDILDKWHGEVQNDA